MNPELRDLRGRIEKLRQELVQIIREAGDQLDMGKVTCISGTSDQKVAYVQALNLELDETVKKAEPLEEQQATINLTRERLKKFGEPLATHPGFPIGNESSSAQPNASLGKAITDAWQESGGLKKEHTYEIDMGEQAAKVMVANHAEMKTLMSSGAGWAPQAIRTGRMVEYATRPVQVLDLIPGSNTSQNAIVYMEETTFTPAATEVKESVEGTAGTYPEAALVLTERNSPVRKLAVFLPVTDEQLEDIPQVQGYLNNRLPFFLRQRLDGQIVNGNGTAPNLTGLASLSGIQTQARSSDPGPDAVYKAIVKCRVTGRASPSAVIFHPTDWQNIRLLRTSDGIYIWGAPMDNAPERIWGLPVAQCDSFSAGTAYVGDFAGFSELSEKRGIEVKVTDSHSTYFIEGKQAVRADFRVALVWYRPTAFCSVTGL
jgi:HK97 family phage major capsid protein